MFSLKKNFRKKIFSKKKLSKLGYFYYFYIFYLLLCIQKYTPGSIVYFVLFFVQN